MGILNGIILIVLGALCVPALIVKKSPNAKALLDKIVPFQGILGIISFVWGLWLVLSCIINLGWIGVLFPFGLILWITWVVNAALNVLAGALLGWALIQKFMLAKAPDNVKAKAEESFAKLLAFQPKIGIVAMVFGLWVIIATIIL